MTGPLKYQPGILNFSSQLKFPEEDVFSTPGLLDIIFRMTGSLKYQPGISNFSSQLKFPEGGLRTLSTFRYVLCLRCQIHGFKTFKTTHNFSYLRQPHYMFLQAIDAPQLQISSN